MACDLSSGRKRPCKDQRGGIKNKVYLAAFKEYGFVVADQQIAALPEDLIEVFAWEVKGPVNKLDETTTVSSDNGTSETTQALVIQLPKLSALTEVQLQLIEAGGCIAFVPDYNGNIMVGGIESGLDVTTRTKSTGGAGTDLSGYVVNLQGMEAKSSPFLSAGAKTALLALVSDTMIEP